MSSRLGLGPKKIAPILDSPRHQSTRSRTPSGFAVSPPGPDVVGSLPRWNGRSWPGVDHDSRFYSYHHPPRDSDPTHLARGRLLTYRGVALPAPCSCPNPRRGPLLAPSPKSKSSGHRWQPNHRRPPRHPRHRKGIHSLLDRCRFCPLSQSQMDESPASLTEASRHGRSGSLKIIHPTSPRDIISAFRILPHMRDPAAAGQFPNSEFSRTCGIPQPRGAFPNPLNPLIPESLSP